MNENTSTKFQQQVSLKTTPWAITKIISSGRKISFYISIKLEGSEIVSIKENTNDKKLTILIVWCP